MGPPLPVIVAWLVAGVAAGAQCVELPPSWIAGSTGVLDTIADGLPLVPEAELPVSPNFLPRRDELPARISPR